MLNFKRKFEDIIKEDSKVQVERLQGENVVRSMNGNIGYQPSIEGKENHRSLPGFLEEDPRDVVGNGTFKKVPLLTGVTRDETANAIDIKNIEKIFSSTTKFLDSVANSLKTNKLLGNVASTLLPGVGKNIAYPMESKAKRISSICFFECYRKSSIID